DGRRPLRRWQDRRALEHRRRRRPAPAARRFSGGLSQTQGKETKMDGGATAQELFDAMNAHDLDRVAAIAAEDVEFVDLATGEQIHGRAEWRAYCARYLKAFSDLRLEQTNVVAMGDKAVVEAVAHGTNDGALDTPQGEIPATGKTIQVPFCMT